MEIEHKNLAYANNDIYQVGNVFSRSGTPFLVVKIEHEPGNVSYGFVDLEKAKNGMEYRSMIPADIRPGIF